VAQSSRETVTDTDPRHSTEYVAPLGSKHASICIPINHKGLIIE
jgi:hypothetical protein